MFGVLLGKRVTSHATAGARVPLLALAGVLIALGFAACGGSERQDENEPAGVWKIDLLYASFPGRQHLADEVRLRITVRNMDDRPIPNLAVTVNGFEIRSEREDLATAERPVWIVNRPPKGSEVAQTNTWAVGEVAPGKTKSLVWNVTAVRPGTYTLRYKVAAGLDGKARAELPDGATPKGSFIARIADEPRPVEID